MNLHFKKTTILLLLCMGALYTTMAQTVNTTYATQINNTLSGLDKSNTKSAGSRIKREKKNAAKINKTLKSIFLAQLLF